MRDGDWTAVDGRPCKVLKFTPLAKFEDGKISSKDKATPYALITLDCLEFPSGSIGAVTHKIDFMHLWTAFIERGIGDDEEVIIFWQKMKLKGIWKLLSAFMPRMAVVVCKSGAYELMANRNYRPELVGEARAIATMPIENWIPEVLA